MTLPRNLSDRRSRSPRDIGSGRAKSEGSAAGPTMIVQTEITQETPEHRVSRATRDISRRSGNYSAPRPAALMGGGSFGVRRSAFRADRTAITVLPSEYSRGGEHWRAHRFSGFTLPRAVRWTFSATDHHDFSTSSQERWQFFPRLDNASRGHPLPQLRTVRGQELADRHSYRECQLHNELAFDERSRDQRRSWPMR